jgi:hypothetical protein
MTELLRFLSEELTNEWGYLLYVALTVWFSIRFLRDRKRDAASLSTLIATMDLRIAGRLNGIERILHLSASSFEVLGGTTPAAPGHKFESAGLIPD